MYNRIVSLQFIQPSHLDIPKNLCENHNLIVWEKAQEELFKLRSQSVKSPYDKLKCIENCCKLIFNSLSDNSGADEFIPILIFIILKSNPPHICSTMKYISTFRRQSALGGEMGYYFTSILGSLTFIETLDASALSIKSDEFIKGLEEQKERNPPVHWSDEKGADFDVRQESESDADWVWIKRKGQPIYLRSQTLLNFANEPLDPKLHQKFMECEAKDLNEAEISRLLYEYRKFITTAK